MVKIEVMCCYIAHFIHVFMFCSTPTENKYFQHYCQLIILS